MPESQAIIRADHLPFTGLGCPKCGYNLTGTTEHRCPECGEVFDPDKLRPYRERRRPSWRVTIASILLAAYLPNTWIFWISYPWRGGYRIGWAKMFPVLPGFYPGAWLSYLTGLHDVLDYWGMIMVAGSVTVIVIVGGVLIGRRSRWWLMSVCLILFVLEIVNAGICHALFRM